MKVIDAIAEILKREGVDFLSVYPTTPIIDACAAIGIRPYICRQERVGAGIADGYARVKNGRPPGVFAMQYGPGAENAFPGVATAYSDSVNSLADMQNSSCAANAACSSCLTMSLRARVRWSSRCRSDCTASIARTSNPEPDAS